MNSKMPRFAESLQQAIKAARQGTSSSSSSGLSSEEALREMEQLNRSVDYTSRIPPDPAIQQGEREEFPLPSLSPLMQEYAEYLSSVPELKDLIDEIPDSGSIQKIIGMIREINSVLKNRLHIITESIIQQKEKENILNFLNVKKLEFGCLYSLSSAEAKIVVVIVSNRLYFISNKDNVYIDDGKIDIKLHSEEAMEETKQQLFQKMTSEVMKLYAIHRDQSKDHQTN
jgi:hypothetical protein